MTEINSETGEVVNNGRTTRFSMWTAFLFFSTITMIASVEEKKKNISTDSGVVRNQGWAVACSAITFAITFIVVAMHLHPTTSSFCVGTKIEGVIIVVLTAFWAGTVSVVSDARNGLAVSSRDGAITNGNLYYFSWAGFVCSIMLIVSYLRVCFGVDLASEIRNRSARLTQWSALLAAQLIVLGASANIFDQDCSPRNNTATFCSRTTYGIALGAIGTAFALVVVGMKIVTASVSFLFEAVVAFILAVMNGFGVAFLTSSEGPGSALGNLYYFSWLSLISSAMLTASCFETYKSTSEGHSPGTESNTRETTHDSVLEDQI